ncbi:MAG: hypothetical protein FD177_2515 [Desulfovibrionaceae bacterium]|nr:MAG: hypothetical protein FD177_2515 [Desulfovibrionaceae bacterium]
MSDFTMVGGDAKEIGIPVVDETGAALNLTGYTVRWGLFSMAGAKLLEKSTATSGVAVDTPASGEVLITLAPTDTAGRSGLYRHECEIIDTNSKPSTVLRGLVEIERGYL